ncbi:hypothetical protein RR46_14506 [Papilio xuthus]|uniref:C-type lectin domain-containing protein n=1 Tax=Papilio xuthus TaxID=66420 RepID=A0A194PCQ9_PAPXU|nr:hypothetical protein RR46_14506 [Papilio xuthus]
MRLQEVCLMFTLMSVISCVNSHSLHGYIKNEKLRTAYRIVYRSQSWPVARDMCAEEGGKLAVPKSEEEFLFLQKLVRGMHYPAVVDAADKLVVWLGISKLHDHKIWTSVDGNCPMYSIDNEARDGSSAIRGLGSVIWGRTIKLFVAQVVLKRGDSAPSNEP